MVNCNYITDQTSTSFHVVAFNHEWKYEWKELLNFFRIGRIKGKDYPQKFSKCNQVILLMIESTKIDIARKILDAFNSTF